MGTHKGISITNTQIHHPNVPFKCGLMGHGFPHWACTAGVHACPAVCQFAASVWDESKAQSAGERSELELALLSHKSEQA